MHACIARQPILDQDREVFGYELLFRSGPENVFTGVDGDVASASVMGDALHIHDLATLASGRQCFINVTRRILTEQLYSILPPDRVVLELLETLEPDEELIEACRRATRSGYTLALDDYTLEPKFDCLLPHVQIIKADFMGIERSQRGDVAALAREHGIKLLAEKVETHEDFKDGCALGYGYFQGFFFCKPEMITNRQIPANRLASLRLLEQVNKPSLDLDDLEGLIRQDTSLSYRLLRFLNSAAFGFRSEISSIRHGLALLGDRPLKRWVSLMVLSQLGSEKPLELLTLSMVRGRFCETAAGALKTESHGADLFMFGMFSVLDAILDRPMPDVLKNMALCDEVRSGLVGENPPLQSLLETAIAFEHGDWDAIQAVAGGSEELVEELSNLYQGAITWAAQLSKDLRPATGAKKAA